MTVDDNEMFEAMSGDGKDDAASVMMYRTLTIDNIAILHSITPDQVRIGTFTSPSYEYTSFATIAAVHRNLPCIKGHPRPTPGAAMGALLEVSRTLLGRQWSSSEKMCETVPDEMSKINTRTTSTPEGLRTSRLTPTPETEPEPEPEPEPESEPKSTSTSTLPDEAWITSARQSPVPEQTPTPAAKKCGPVVRERLTQLQRFGGGVGEQRQQQTRRVTEPIGNSRQQQQQVQRKPVPSPMETLQEQRKTQRKSVPVPSTPPEDLQTSIKRRCSSLSQQFSQTRTRATTLTQSATQLSTEVSRVDPVFDSHLQKLVAESQAGIEATKQSQLLQTRLRYAEEAASQAYSELAKIQTSHSNISRAIRESGEDIKVAEYGLEERRREWVAAARSNVWSGDESVNLAHAEEALRAALCAEDGLVQELVRKEGILDTKRISFLERRDEAERVWADLEAEGVEGWKDVTEARYERGWKEAGLEFVGLLEDHERDDQSTVHGRDTLLDAVAATVKSGPMSASRVNTYHDRRMSSVTTATHPPAAVDMSWHDRMESIAERPITAFTETDYRPVTAAETATASTARAYGRPQLVNVSPEVTPVSRFPSVEFPSTEISGLNNSTWPDDDDYPSSVITDSTMTSPELGPASRFSLEVDALDIRSDHDISAHDAEGLGINTEPSTWRDSASSLSTASTAEVTGEDTNAAEPSNTWPERYDYNSDVRNSVTTASSPDISPASRFPCSEAVRLGIDNDTQFSAEVAALGINTNVYKTWPEQEDVPSSASTQSQSTMTSPELSPAFRFPMTTEVQGLNIKNGKSSSVEGSKHDEKNTDVDSTRPDADHNNTSSVSTISTILTSPAFSPILNTYNVQTGGVDINNDPQFDLVSDARSEGLGINTDVANTWAYRIQTHEHDIPSPSASPASIAETGGLGSANDPYLINLSPAIDALGIDDDDGQVHDIPTSSAEVAGLGIDTDITGTSWPPLTTEIPHSASTQSTMTPFSTPNTRTSHSTFSETSSYVYEEYRRDEDEEDVRLDRARFGLESEIAIRKDRPFSLDLDCYGRCEKGLDDDEGEDWDEGRAGSDLVVSSGGRGRSSVRHSFVTL